MRNAEGGMRKAEPRHGTVGTVARFEKSQTNTPRNIHPLSKKAMCSPIHRAMAKRLVTTCRTQPVNEIPIFVCACPFRPKEPDIPRLMTEVSQLLSFFSREIMLRLEVPHLEAHHHFSVIYEYDMRTGKRTPIVCSLSTYYLHIRDAGTNERYVVKICSPRPWKARWLFYAFEPFPLLSETVFETEAQKIVDHRDEFTDFSCTVLDPPGSAVLVAVPAEYKVPV
jgi:hypothetical protein